MNTEQTTEAPTLPQNDTPLRVLVDVRQSLQQERIRFGNRLDAVHRGTDTASTITEKLIERWKKDFANLETNADKDIKSFCKDLPVIKVMTRVKAVGILSAAKIVSMIDITRANTVSALWRYAGYGVVKDEEGNGKAERPVKGEKLHYNARLKTACYVIATQFLNPRMHSPYRKVYDESKLYYQEREANKPEKERWTKGRIHNAAIRKMVKLWLSHLWITWREMENLPVSKPYILAHEPEKHTQYIPPEEFGWADQPKKVKAKKSSKKGK